MNQALATALFPSISHLPAPVPAPRGDRPEAVLLARAVDIDLGIVAGAHLRGRLGLVDVAGIGRRRPVATPAEIAESERACVEWATRIGLSDGIGGYLQKFCRSKLAALAAYTLPDVKPERARWFIYLQAFIFTIDDALDNLEDIRKGDAYLPFERLADILHVFADALAGVPIDPERARLAATEFPLFDAFHAAILTVRRLALETGLDISPFVAAMRDYFDALAWEHGAHAAAAYTPTLSTYVCNREQTISYIQSIESFLLIKGIVMPPELRSRHPIRLLLLSACRHVILVNDVFSLQKEIQCAELDNVLLLDEPAPEAASLARRFDSLLARIEALGADIAHVARKVLETFPGDAAVQGYVETILNSVNGHIAWYAESHRYGSVVHAASAGRAG